MAQSDEWSFHILPEGGQTKDDSDHENAVGKNVVA